MQMLMAASCWTQLPVPSSSCSSMPLPISPRSASLGQWALCQDCLRYSTPGTNLRSLMASVKVITLAADAVLPVCVQRSCLSLYSMQAIKQETIAAFDSYSGISLFKLVHSLTHSLTHSLALSPPLSLALPLTHPSIHSLNLLTQRCKSLTHSLPAALILECSGASRT